MESFYSSQTSQSGSQEGSRFFSQDRSRLFKRRGHGRQTTLRQFSIVRNWDKTASPAQKKRQAAFTSTQKDTHDDVLEKLTERSLSLSSILSQSPTSPVVTKSRQLFIPETQESPEKDGSDDSVEQPNSASHTRDRWSPDLQDLSHISASQISPKANSKIKNTPVSRNKISDGSGKDFQYRDTELSFTNYNGKMFLGSAKGEGLDASEHGEGHDGSEEGEGHDGSEEGEGHDGSEQGEGHDGSEQGEGHEGSEQSEGHDGSVGDRSNVEGNTGQDPEWLKEKQENKMLQRSYSRSPSVKRSGHRSDRTMQNTFTKTPPVKTSGLEHVEGKMSDVKSTGRVEISHRKENMDEVKSGYTDLTDEENMDSASSSKDSVFNKDKRDLNTLAVNKKELSQKTSRVRTPLIQQKLQVKTPDSLKPFVTYTRRGSKPKMKSKKALHMTTPVTRSAQATFTPTSKTGQRGRKAWEGSAPATPSNDHVNITISTPAVQSEEESDLDGDIRTKTTANHKPRNRKRLGSDRREENAFSHDVQDLDLRMWHGGRLRRRLPDITDLDVALNSIEDEIVHFRDDLDHAPSVRALNYFGSKMRKDITSMIELRQEVKRNKFAQMKMRHNIAKSRDDLMFVQNKATRESQEISKLEGEIEKIDEEDKDWKDISSFLTGLQHLHTEFKKCRSSKAEQDFIASSNLTAMVTDTKVTAGIPDRLSELNDQLEDWLHRQ